MLLGRRCQSLGLPRRSSGRLLQSSRLSLAPCRSSTQSCAVTAAPTDTAALRPLFDGVRAHESGVSAVIVLEDARDGAKVVVSASMDKTIAAWRLVPNEDSDAAHPFYCEVQKISAPGGPIFSMAPSRPLFGQAQPSVKAPATAPATGTTLFCGNAAKEVVSWQPFMPSFNPLKLDGHKGWVRAVATYDKYLFSCGCNYLRQWDCTYATPKMVRKVKLFTGDILAIAAGRGYVYTACANGSLRSWSVDKVSGAMAEAAVQERAHDGRICGLLCNGGFVYSAGCDGSIKMWRRESLELVAQARHAHGGEKVQCLAMAGNGVLYSGGDDQCIRAWSPDSLQPLPGFDPLKVHSSAVRMLAAGKSEMLVSGDSEGYLSFFQVPPAAALPLPPAEPYADMFTATAPAAKVSQTAASASAAGAESGAIAFSSMGSMGSRDDDEGEVTTMSECEFSATLSPQPHADDDIDSGSDSGGEDSVAGGGLGPAAAAQAAVPGADALPEEDDDDDAAAAAARRHGPSDQHAEGAMHDQAPVHDQASVPGSFSKAIGSEAGAGQAATPVPEQAAVVLALAFDEPGPAAEPVASAVEEPADTEDAAGNAAAATAAMAYRSMDSAPASDAADVRALVFG